MSGRYVMLTVVGGLLGLVGGVKQSMELFVLGVVLMVLAAVIELRRK